MSKSKGNTEEMEFGKNNPSISITEQAMEPRPRKDRLFNVITSISLVLILTALGDVVRAGNRIDFSPLGLPENVPWVLNGWKVIGVDLELIDGVGRINNTPTQRSYYYLDDEIEPLGDSIIYLELKMQLLAGRDPTSEESDFILALFSPNPNKRLVLEIGPSAIYVGSPRTDLTGRLPHGTDLTEYHTYRIEIDSITGDGTVYIDNNVVYENYLYSGGGHNRFSWGDVKTNSTQSCKVDIEYVKYGQRNSETEPGDEEEEAVQALPFWTQIPSSVSLSDYAFKFSNYVAVWVDPDDEQAVIDFTNLPSHPFGQWKANVFIEVFNANGSIGRYSLPPGQTLQVPLTQPEHRGVLLLYMQSRRAYHKVIVGDRPWAFVDKQTKAAIDVVPVPDRQERLYFYVPPDSTRIDLRANPLATGSHSYIVGPDNELMLDFVKQEGGLATPHQIVDPVPEYAQEKIASWVLPSDRNRLALGSRDSGIFPLFSPNPDHLQVFVEQLAGKPWQEVPGYEIGQAVVPDGVLDDYVAARRREAPNRPGTRMPLIYCAETLDANRILNPSLFVEHLTTRGTTGPHALDLGLHGPFSTLYGDTRELVSMGYSVRPDLSIKRTNIRARPVSCPAPAQFQNCIAQIQLKANLFEAMNTTLEQAGVQQRLIYTSAQYFYGDAGERLGVFHLYDHWEEYQQTFPDLGPKPGSPPEDWVLWLEGKKSGPVDTDNVNAPGLFRYTASLHNPSWRRFVSGIVAVAARFGVSGAHIDLAGQHYDDSPLAREGFRDYLQSKYSVQELLELFGIEPPYDIHEPRPRPAVTDPTLLDIEREHYQLGVVSAGFWNVVRQAGESIRGRGNFWVHAGSEDARDYVAHGHDSIMYEEADRVVGVIDKEILPGIPHFLYNSLIYEYKSDQAYAALPLKERARFAGAILSRNRSFGEYAVRLGIAEGAAFSSGGGGFSTLTPGYVFDINRAFFERNPKLYDFFHGGGFLGILQDNHNATYFYNHQDHIAANTRLSAALLEQQIPFDFISRPGVKDDLLDRYKVVTALSMSMVDNESLEYLTDYVSRGGILLVDDRFALEDEWIHARTTLPWGDYVGIAGYDVFLGKGRVVSLPAQTHAGDIIDNLDAVVSREYARELPTLASPTPGLRTNILYHKQGKKGIDVTAHLLNYNVPLVEGAYSLATYSYAPDQPWKPRILDNVELALPIPHGYQVRSLQVFSPDFEVQPAVTYGVVDGLLQVNVDSLFIYNVVKVRMKRQKVRRKPKAAARPDTDSLWNG